MFLTSILRPSHPIHAAPCILLPQDDEEGSLTGSPGGSLSNSLQGPHLLSSPWGGGAQRSFGCAGAAGLSLALHHLLPRRTGKIRNRESSGGSGGSSRAGSPSRRGGGALEAARNAMWAGIASVSGDVEELRPRSSASTRSLLAVSSVGIVGAVAREMAGRGKVRGSWQEPVRQARARSLVPCFCL